MASVKAEHADLQSKNITHLRRMDPVATFNISFRDGIGSEDPPREISDASSVTWLRSTDSGSRQLGHGIAPSPAFIAM
jgi:hypothetical protein